MFRAVSGACVRGTVAPVRWNQDLELISPPVKIQNFLLCRLLCLHNPMEWPWFLWGRVPKGIRHGPFPGELCLSLSVQKDDKPTLFSPTSNSNLTFHSYLIPCCAVLAFRFLLNCSQGGTEELHSKSQLSGRAKASCSPADFCMKTPWDFNWDHNSLGCWVDLIHLEWKPALRSSMKFQIDKDLTNELP